MSGQLVHCLVCLRQDDRVDASIRMSNQMIGRFTVREDGRCVRIVTRSNTLHTGKVETELTPQKHEFDVILWEGI